MIAAVLWAYAPALRGGWVWDDAAEVTGNLSLRGGVGSLGGIWAGRSGPDYFPLKTSLQWVEWHLFGAHPLGYHAINLGLHLLSACLAWRIFLRLGLAPVWAWFGALLFALHPLAVESVAWIAEFKNALSLPLLLLAGSAWLEAEGAPAGDAPRRGRYLASLGWFLAAALAKTTVVMFPVWLLVHRWWRRGRVRGPDLAATAPFFGISAALGVVAVRFQAHRALQDQAVAVTAWPARAGEAGRALFHYAGRCLFPAGTGPLFPDWSGSGWAWAAAAVAAGGAPVFILLRRPTAARRAGLLAVAWFGLHLLPVLGLVPMSYARISPVADHFAYLSLVGAAAAAAAGAGWVMRRCRGRAVRGVLAALLAAGVVLAAAASRTEAWAYRSEAAFWQAALRRNPDAWIARSNLGLQLLAAGRTQEAEEHLRAAVAHGGAVPETHNNHGKALGALGRAREAAAEFRAAVALEPRFVDAWINLGTARLADGRAAEALAAYDRALTLRPGSAAIRSDRGMALEQLGRGAEAADAYRGAAEADPGGAEPHYRLGNLLANEGRLDAAMAEYRAALERKPDFPEAAANWGLALALAHRPSEAIALLEPLARAHPFFSEAHAYLGMAFESTARPAEAAAEYGFALRSAPGNADLHYHLAVALQALGRTAEAQREFAAAERLSHPR